MNWRRFAPEVLVLLAAVLLLVPGITSLWSTPYGPTSAHLWLAALYASTTAWALLVLGIRALRRAGSLGRRVLVAVVFVGAFALAALLPFGALVAGHYLFGAFSGGSEWVLFNKYLGHLLASTHSGYLWVVSWGLVATAITLKGLPFASNSAPNNMRPNPVERA